MKFKVAGDILSIDMDPKQYLTRLKNRKQYNDLLAEILDHPEDFSQEWLIEHRWVAVPIPDRIIEKDAIAIIKSVSKYFNEEKILAISTDIGTNDIFEFKEFSVKTLLEFDRYYSLYNFVILSSDISFCILKEAGLYVIIAGPSSFVEDASSLPVSSMMAEFWEYATDKSWFEPIKKHLVKIADKYVKINQLLLDSSKPN